MKISVKLIGGICCSLFSTFCPAIADNTVFTKVKIKITIQIIGSCMYTLKLNKAYGRLDFIHLVESGIQKAIGDLPKKQPKEYPG